MNREEILQKLAFLQTQLKETGHYKTPNPRKFVPHPILATPLFTMRMAWFYWYGYVESGFPNYAEDWWSVSSYRVLESVERTGGTVEYEGFENLNLLNGETAVITSNHVSSVETYLFPPAFIPWHNVAYVLKESLRSYPLLGRLIRAIDPIPVGRKNAIEDLRKVLREGKAAMEGGRFVIIFPQGSRYRLFDPKTYNSLGTKLAKHANRPVVPCCVATDFHRIGEWHRDLTASCHPTSPVRVACGKPIPADTPAADMQRMQLEFIDSTLARWEDLDHRKMRVTK